MFVPHCNGIQAACHLCLMWTNPVFQFHLSCSVLFPSCSGWGPWVHLKEQRLCLFCFLSLRPRVSGSMNVDVASQEMRCVSYNPDEPTRSVMVRPGWNINRVCLRLHMRVHTCVCMCVWVDKLLCLTLGLTRVWQAYIWRRCCLREWGFRGSILYEETQGKEDFFLLSFTLGPSVDFHSDRILHFQALML